MMWNLRFLDIFLNLWNKFNCIIPGGKLSEAPRMYPSEQVRMPGFGQGGAPASEAESCWRSEAESRERSEHSAAGVQGPLKGPGSFWVFDAQICIFTHSRDSFSLIFDIYFDTKSW